MLYSLPDSSTVSIYGLYIELLTKIQELTEGIFMLIIGIK